MDTIYQALLQILPENQMKRQEPMSLHTTFKIGGSADLFIMPHTQQELCAVLACLARYDAPMTILGCGSNMLVLDKGIRGSVISLCHMTEPLRVEGETIIAAAGVTLKDVSEFAYAQGLTGLEFAIGIPGTLGGAVFMNAGAYDGEMAFVVESVTAVTSHGELRLYGRDELQFAYRHSAFQETHDIISEVRIRLHKGDAVHIREKMDELTLKRESKQPLEMPSAGSTFKRPEGYFAGTLIDQTGLKGFSVGGAQISEKHAGFVVNHNNATARDVLELIEEVQKRVYEKHGVHLEPEVRLLGER